MRYEAVKSALEAGMHPDALCATCPWDRLCVTPPESTSADIRRKIDAAVQEDMQKNPKGMPIGALMTALMTSGSDSKGEMCPVFVTRLSGLDGRALADHLKQYMQRWPA